MVDGSIYIIDSIRPDLGCIRSLLITMASKFADKRAVFDFEIDFSNGGGLQGQQFRLDIPGDEISDQELADCIVKDLRLLMVGDVRILNKKVIAESHKRAGNQTFKRHQ